MRRTGSSLWCAGLSLSRPLLLRSTGSGRAGSAIVAHGPSCSAACGILPNQGSNPCPPHRQADSQPLCHQGSPFPPLLTEAILTILRWNLRQLGVYKSISQRQLGLEQKNKDPLVKLTLTKCQIILTVKIDNRQLTLTIKIEKRN